MKKKHFLGLFLFVLMYSLPGQHRDGMEYSVHDEASLLQYRQKASALKEAGDPLELANCYRSLANYYYKGHGADSTLHYYRLALEQYQLTGDSFHLQYCRFRIGQTIASEGKNLASALDWLVPAALYFERINEQLLAAHALYSLSDTYKSLQNDSLRKVYWHKAELRNELAGDTILILIMQAIKAQELLDSNQWNEALPLTEKVIALSRAGGKTVFLKTGLVQLGNTLLHMGMPLKAIPPLEESLTLMNSTYSSHTNAHFLLALSYLKSGQKDLAEKYFRKYKELSLESAQRQKQDNYEEMLVQYESEKKEAAIASLENENKLKETIARQQRAYIIGLSIGLVLLLVGVWFIIKNARKRRELQEVIHQQQEQFAYNLQNEKEQKMTAEFNKQLAEVQLTALSAQMNPHFIFNCMNSIQKYILKNEKGKALDFLQHFSELMRDVLDNSTKAKVALDEEIGMLEKYIKLEQLRLDEKFDYNIDIAKDLQADFFEIPGMIIQPYIENAIWHGLMHKADKGHLQLNFDKQNSSIRCVIRDNGVGRKKSAELERPMSPRRKGYGIQLSQKRLELLHQEEEDIPTVMIEDLTGEQNQPTGTQVTIYFHIEN